MTFSGAPRNVAWRDSTPLLIQPLFIRAGLLIQCHVLGIPIKSWGPHIWNHLTKWPLKFFTTLKFSCHAHTQCLNYLNVYFFISECFNKKGQIYFHNYEVTTHCSLNTRHYWSISKGWIAFPFLPSMEASGAGVPHWSEGCGSHAEVHQWHIRQCRVAAGVYVGGGWKRRPGWLEYRLLSANNSADCINKYYLYERKISESQVHYCWKRYKPRKKKEPWGYELMF